MIIKINILRAIEKHIGEKLDDNISEILTKAGFNSKATVLAIKPQSIETIEEFVNGNRDTFFELFQNTKYEHCETFKLLPGHAALILSLPDVCKEFTSEKQKGRQLKKRRHSECSDHPDETTHKATTQNSADEAILRDKLIDDSALFRASYTT